MKPGRTLLELGAEHCSDAELLAILIGSGGRDYSALDSANAILDKYGTLGGLMNRADSKTAESRRLQPNARAGATRAAFAMPETNAYYAP